MFKRMAERMKSTGLLLVAVLRGAWELPWVTEKTLRRWRRIASAIWAALLSGSLVFLYQKPNFPSIGGAIAVAECVMFYVTYILVLSLVLEAKTTEKRTELMRVWIGCCVVVIALGLLMNLLAPEVTRRMLSLVNLAMVVLVAVPLTLRSHDAHLEKKQRIDEIDRLLRENREFLRDLEIMEKFSEPCRIDVVLPGVRATGVVVPKSLKDLVSEKLFGRFVDDWPDETDEADNTIYGAIEFGTDCEE